MNFQAAEPQPLIHNRVQRHRHYPRAARVLIVALLLGISWAGIVLFLTSLGIMWQSGEQVHGWFALGGLGLFALGRAAAFVLGRHLNCSLCHGPVLHEKNCHKHVDAFRILPLSYRNSTVVSLLGTGKFRCMYCGTPYRLRREGHAHCR